jgi:hypothetical protein
MIPDPDDRAAYPHDFVYKMMSLRRNSVGTS